MVYGLLLSVAMLSLRTLVLAALPLLSLTAAPKQVHACSPLFGFTITRVFPAADAVQVPRDGAIVILGYGAFGAEIDVVVKHGDEEIAGSLVEQSDERYVWRSEQPLAADTTFAVHIFSEGDIPSEFAGSFTTSDVFADEPQPAEIASKNAVAWDKDIQECIEPGGLGSCTDCWEWEVVGTEKRLRLLTSIAAPEGPFDGFYLSRVDVGPTPESLTLSNTTGQTDVGTAMSHTIDLGPAGEWPGDEVCVRGQIIDPLALTAEGEVTCVDVSQINVIPDDEEDTETGPDSDSTPTSGDESDDESGDESGPEGDGGDKGCGCRGSDAPAGPAALLIAGFGLALAGRRRRSV